MGIEDRIPVKEMLERAGFKVILYPKMRRGSFNTLPDLLATAPDRMRYAIEYVDILSPHGLPRDLNDARPAAGNIFDELWLVIPTDVPRIEAMTDRDVLAFTAVDSWCRVIHENELEAFLREVVAQKSESSSASTEQGEADVVRRAIIRNGTQLVLTISGLQALLDEKIESLGKERPNSNEAIKRRGDAVANYESLRASLDRLNRSVAELKKEKPKETRRHIKQVLTFADGLRNWWTRSHEQICTSGFDAGLFASAVAICSMAGAGGNLSVIVSAALVGGKPVTTVLKELAKKVKGD